MTRIITIRPEPGATATAEAGKAIGLAIDPFPMSAVEPRTWQGPAPEEVDALLLGSANGVRMAGAEIERYRDKPVFAVGETTAKFARAAGFAVELAGEGGLQNLLERIEQRPLRLLRLSGERMVPVNLPDGVSVETRVVYTAPDLPMPEEMQQILQSGDALVLLHSAGAAEHFRAECLRLDLNISRIRVAALGPRIAGAAKRGWADKRFARQPANGVLLALAKEMCQ